MSAPETGIGRMRAYLQFVAAVFYFFLARSLAHHGALGLATQEWAPLVDQAMLVFLLLLGYAAFGFWMDRQSRPVSEQGLPRRAGWPREAALGLAAGWSIAVLCVLPMVLDGGIAIVLSLQPSAWGWLVADAAFFALLALAEEIAFRGYGFQRFAHAVGPIGAALGYAAFYAIVQALLPGSSHASIAVSVALSLVLSTAYLRTRALWVSWGINFGWRASRALVFGLAVSGINSHSPVVQGDPMGPFWLTGGGYGLDGSWVSFFVLLAALPVVYRLTRELDYRYNAPVIVPGGIPVDLNAAARRQHEAAMGPAEPAAPSLVQILPVAAPPAAPPNEPAPGPVKDL
ncbi:MAG TPA: CPBP family intramembrane glutamic endopeptidase [Terracidiphilus sp.]|nr:CPBP family intramembrane glutamic endopeptidase [Terracidiphilus sp.]